MTVDNLERFVSLMPKVELHVHLEGSIQPQTLLELAHRRHIDLPAGDVAGLRDWFRFRDFEHFVEIYLTCCRCLRDPEDFQLVMDQFMAEQERQNILYSEVHFTIGTHLANGVNGEEVAQALGESIEAGRKRRGVRVRLIPDIVRNVGPERADETLEWALAARRYGVVALGLSGFESSPDEPFAEHFEVAEAEGLHRVAHAGEHEGPETIRSVLDVCRVERIGHGIRAVDDPGLMAELADRAIPLEICPTSNVCLGAVSEIAAHPFDHLYRAGIVTTVNSDDPPQFETDLNREYVDLAVAFGYGAGELTGFAWNALQAAFLTDEARQELIADFDARLTQAGVQRHGDSFEADESPLV